MAINFFQTLNAVLDKGIADICHAYSISEIEAVKKVRKHLEDNSAAYYSADMPRLSYNDALCRMAYLYAYVGAHANLIDNALHMFRPLGDFVRKRVNDPHVEVLHVCSLGGGPGSELLGFVKFIEREQKSNSQIDLDFALVDNVRQWDETWHALVDGLQSTFRATHGSNRRKWPIAVHRSFLSLDLTNVSDFEDFRTRFGEVEIFVINHTVSELMFSPSEVSQAFNNLVERASNEAYFLFIDRNQTEVVKFIDQMASHKSLSLLAKRTQQTNMDSDEEKRALGKWYTSIGRDPKITWNAYFVVAQKHSSPL